MQTKLYDPKSLVATFGINTLSGFAEDSMIEVEFDEDAFTKTVGVDGEVTRTRNANASGKATVKLLQTSATNAILSAIHKADKLAANGTGIFPFMVKDTSGNSLCFAKEAWIVKSPKSTWEKNSTSREWVFALAKLEQIDGGN